MKILSLALLMWKASRRYFGQVFGLSLFN